MISSDVYLLFLFFESLSELIMFSRNMTNNSWLVVMRRDGNKIL